MNKVKYSTQTILKQVRDIILSEDNNKEVSLKKISSKKNIPVKDLELFFNDYDFLNLEMYKTSAQLLEISLEEITYVETINADDVISSVKCREGKNNESKEYQENFINLNKYNIEIFSNIIDILKLGGEFYEWKNS